MKSDWMNSFSHDMPQEFEQTNENEWRQNVNIHEDTITYEGPEGEDVTEEGYAYQTRILDKKAYTELMDTLYTPAHEKIEANQAAGDDDRISLMEAMAEIYELLLMATGGEE